MHIVHTFVVRLFVDPQAPGVIKGSIQDIFGAAPIPFNDLQALLELFERLVREQENTPSPAPHPFSDFGGGQL